MNDFFSDAYILAKHHKMPFVESQSRSPVSFNLLHINLWGPYRIATNSREKYFFLTIMDDHTRVSWTHLPQTKDQVPSIISRFLEYVSNHFKTMVKHIGSDNGSKNLQEICTSLFKSKGIIHRRSLPGVPQQNGRIERKHRHLLDTARALKLHAKLPIEFLGDCLLSATYLINLMPNSVLDWKIPFHLLMSKPPSYDHLRVIGCLCFAAVKFSNKFAPRARKCIFLGYPFAQKGYKLFDLDSKQFF